MNLWKKVFLGIVLGIIMGRILSGNTEVLEYINMAGVMFMRLIRMLMYPLVFCAIVNGILNVTNGKSLKIIGTKIISLGLVSTIFAVLFGVGVASIFKPGKTFNNTMLLKTYSKTQKLDVFDVKKFIIEIIPDNIFASFSQGNLLQIVFFAVFTGIICHISKDYLTDLRNKVVFTSNILFDMMTRIMNLSPYGSFFLITYTVGSQGFESLSSLANLLFCVALGMFLQYLLFGLVILVFCRKSPIPFYRKSFSYQMLAFSVSSSKVALPYAIKVCEESLGVSRSTANVALPISASLNMTGTAIAIGITTIFFSQVYGLSLSLVDYSSIILLSTIGAIGGAGVPGASLLILPLVLQSIHLPTEGVILLIGIDRILDMLRTLINITGDVLTTIIIDHFQNTMDYKKYYS